MCTDLAKYQGVPAHSLYRQEKANLGVLEAHPGGGKVFPEAYNPADVSAWAQSMEGMPEIAAPFEAKVVVHNTAVGSAPTTPEQGNRKKKYGTIRQTLSRVKRATIRHSPSKKESS